VDASYFWITMKLYRTSLKSWRSKQTRSLSENLLLYLHVYSQVLDTMVFLAKNHVNHFDIKYAHANSSLLLPVHLKLFQVRQLPAGTLR
jgi:hypothetical protein